MLLKKWMKVHPLSLSFGSLLSMERAEKGGKHAYIFLFPVILYPCWGREGFVPISRCLRPRGRVHPGRVLCLAEQGGNQLITFHPRVNPGRKTSRFHVLDKSQIPVSVLYQMCFFCLMEF